MTARVLRQLVAGFAFLHRQAKLIYRDLEDKHVGQDGKGRACVFDLSTCVKARAEPSSISYAGERCRCRPRGVLARC